MLGGAKLAAILVEIKGSSVAYTGCPFLFGRTTVARGPSTPATLERRTACFRCGRVVRLHADAFGVLQREPQLLGQPVHGAEALPGAVGLEPQ